MNYPPENIELQYPDDKILWMLGNNEKCRWSNFIKKPIKIPRATLSKYLKQLITKNYIEKRLDENGQKIYRITSKGFQELARRLEREDLDFYDIIELEKKKINSQITKLNPFFDKYNINDDLIKIDFLTLYNIIKRDESLFVFSDDQFNKLLLYLVLNDIKFNKEVKNVMSLGEYLRKFDIDPEIILTKIDIMFFIQEVVEKNRYQTKIFKIDLEKEGCYLYFRSDSEIGVIFESVIRKHLRYLNYLKTLDNSEIYFSDLEDIKKDIMTDLFKRYELFNKDIKIEVSELVDDYITDLQIELQEKPILKQKEVGDLLSIFSPFVGFPLGFETLGDDMDFYKPDIRETFRKIREKEPKNKSLTTASRILYSEKKPKLALKEINDYLKEDPNDIEALDLKSKILDELGNYEEALHLFNKVFENEEFEDPIPTFKIELLIKLKRYDEALAIIKNIPNLFKNEENFKDFLEREYIFHRFYIMEAEIYFELEKFKMALNSINLDLKYTESFLDTDEDEEFINSYILMSKILMKLDKTEESIKALTKVISINPEEPDLYYKRAKIYYQYLDINKIILDILMALELDPFNEKYQKFYDEIMALSFFSLYGFFFKVIILEELSAISKKNLKNLSLNILIRLIFDSIAKKKNQIYINERHKELIEDLDFSEFIKSEVNDDLKKGLFKLDNGVLSQDTVLLKEFFNKHEFADNGIVIRYFIASLFNIYKENGWIEVPKESLIVIAGKTDGIAFLKALDESRVSFINIMINDKFLVKSKSNKYILDRKKLREDFELNSILSNKSYSRIAISF